MVRRVQIDVLCDVCAAGDVDTPGDTQLIQLHGLKPLELELCEAHDKELVKPLRDVLAELGSKPMDRTSAVAVPRQHQGGAHEFSELVQCLWCDHKPFGSQSGMTGHLRDAHQMPGQVVAVFTDCPFCGEAIGNQGPAFGHHVRAEHPGKPTMRPVAYQVALREGDPLGVVQRLIDAPPVKRKPGRPRKS